MGRLQRDHAGSIAPVSTFVQVLYRHGLVMGISALTLFALNTSPHLLATTLADFSANPTKYLLYLMAILVFFYLFLVRKGLSLNLIQGFWIIYLLYISIVEEIAFRLFLPLTLESSISFFYAVIFSNFVFAGAHYFTLRWKWQNCALAFFGGIALSGLLERSDDLALLILMHFVGTFINTPSQPRHNTEGSIENDRDEFIIIKKYSGPEK